MLIVLILMLPPAARGTASAFDAFENPTRPDTPEEIQQRNSDMWRMLVAFVSVVGLLFVLAAGG